MEIPPYIWVICLFVCFILYYLINKTNLTIILLKCVNNLENQFLIEMIYKDGNGNHYDRNVLVVLNSFGTNQTKYYTMKFVDTGEHIPFDLKDTLIYFIESGLSEFRPKP